MFSRRSVVLYSMIIVTILVSSLGFTRPVFAQSCTESYTVASGDTLREIATLCGTTVAALTRANPQITNANLIFPGQKLVLPGALLVGTSGTDIYVVKRGDTLRSLATRFNTTTARLLELNPAITNANLIYEGQRLTVPSAGVIPPTGNQVYTVQRGDTLRIIAARYNTTVDALLKLNPGIQNANLIFPGQQLIVPATASTYTVVRGDTLRAIANRFGVTVAKILELNPTIKNADLIYPGQVLKLR